MDFLNYTALELGRQIRKRNISAVEVTRAVCDKIYQNKKLNLYITLDGERAINEAEIIQKKIDSKEITSVIAGVPMALKDNICTKGIRTTCGSRILENFVPSYDAEVVELLRKSGAVIIGKTNMDEFAMGSTTETSAFGAALNPRNREHVPGGSSGGCAATVAANECFYALGSDTGGSIRQPASHCGVVGLKPTYGSVSRYGLIAYSSSCDQIGPITKDVADCAAVLDIISSYDCKDSTSLYRDNNYLSSLVKDVSGMKIGIPTDYFNEGLSEDVRRAVFSAIKVFKDCGAWVEEFELGLTEYAIPAYYTIASAEASSNLARYDGVKYGYRANEYSDLHDMYKRSRTYGFGSEVKRRIMLGNFVLSEGYYDAYYLKALKLRRLIKQSFDTAFKSYDVIITPVSPATAPKLGDTMINPVQMYLQDIYTVMANLAGIPAISVPCGTDGNGLPIGLQIMGDCYEEKKILRMAYTYEQAVKGIL